MDRRGFLRSTAAIGSGWLLSSRMAVGAPGRAPERIHVAMIGTGTQGRQLLKSCLEIPGVRVQAICDIWTAFSRRRAERDLEAVEVEPRGYADYREMLDREKGLHAVIVATPDFVHAEHAIACMKAGLHVYCERPMSNTLEGARSMALVARETGRLLQIGHQRRSNPGYLHCRERLLGELRLLGRLTAVNGQWNRPAGSDRGWPRRYAIGDDTLKAFGYPSMHHFRNWRWYRALGSGPLGEHGSDQIDVFNWMVGERPSSVLACGGTDYYERKTHEWYDTVMAICGYETRKGPVRAFYQTINANGSYGHYERLLGDEGTLTLSEAVDQVRVYREPDAPDWKKWVELEYLKDLSRKGETKKKDEGDSLFQVHYTILPSAYALPIRFEEPYHKPHLVNFFDAIRGEGRLNCPPEIGYQAVVAVSKLNESVATGRKLELRPEEFSV